ncbi:hypothetical protein B4U79_05473 [Dinothrombium tinctorium]|uniref:Chitin-binding type-2 domain-containing protein n=1 Tax=Dinothrombium tinctorium TaxID=1965070 RepID=A0A3S3R3C0_9ACAR|nr:hypothetical protein B4U79_10079 [Dinothrombium tinctorium]RWS16453.1 hypothetical protein B4U79_03890 [Dinothrombium tinctorium]RWS17811.1 hypothetical protein B4U79_05473 [Dinothrombium tinctorium]
MCYGSRRAHETGESNDLNTSGSINRGVFSKRKGLVSSNSNQLQSQPSNGRRISSRKGTPGVDYPVYKSIPKTSFECGKQRVSGIYADVETNCQVWHMCQGNRIHSFLCPNGTIFNEKTGVCDWWYNVDCPRRVDAISLKLNLDEKPKLANLRRGYRG